MNLKGCSSLEIVHLIKEGKIKAKDLTDNGICPTCFDREYKNILYGEKKNKLIYEDDDIEILFEARPRSMAHTIILSKKHYKNMSEIPDELCNKVMLFSKLLMNIIKKIYHAESVYLCTMCDGQMNHFHVQLIPRYKNEERGSKNFVKPRKDYVYDDRIKLVQEEIKKYLLKNK